MKLPPSAFPSRMTVRTCAGHGASPSKSSRSLVLFVFIDAFGWTLLQRHRFLDDILSVKRPLATVFGYSSTCDPTILTGKLPREHGHFAFFRYAPAESPFRALPVLRFLPAALMRRGRVRHLLSRLLKRLYCYSGYFQLYNMPFRRLPLFDYTEKRDIYRPGGINHGQPTIFDHLRGAGVPFHVSDWRRSEDDALLAAESALSDGAVRFAYVYLAEMDALMHRYGTDSWRVGEKIRGYEKRLRKLLAVARQTYDDVRLHVFSDHGMTDVGEHCDLMSAIDQLGFRFGEDYVAVYDSTMARFWFLNERAREGVMEALRREPRGRIMTNDELELFGCDFAGQEYGEVFFLLDPGVLLCPSFMSDTPLAAMHGYDPRHPSSTAMYATNVVGESPPLHLADLFDVMVRDARMVAA